MATITVDQEFTLNLIASALKGHSPTLVAHDPRGAWDLSYKICSLAGDCAEIGSLDICRRPNEGGVNFTITHRQHLIAGSRYQQTAEVTTDSSDTPNPLKWSWRALALDAQQAPVPLTAIEKSAEADAEGYTVRVGDSQRRHLLGAPRTLLWLVFDAVQRMPRGGEPVRFSLIDDYDQPRGVHLLCFSHTADIVFTNGTQTLHAYDLTGPGSVPWVFWVDDTGRLLFAVTGIEAYLLKEEPR